MKYIVHFAQWYIRRGWGCGSGGKEAMTLPPPDRIFFLFTLTVPMLIIWYVINIRCVKHVESQTCVCFQTVYDESTIE